MQVDMSNFWVWLFVNRRQRPTLRSHRVYIDDRG